MFAVRGRQSDKLTPGDTLTVPSDELFDVMKAATRGDSVYDEDRSVIELERSVAERTGKEAALFCASGTMTNQLGIRATLGGPPLSVICDDRAHIHHYEAGGLAVHSSAVAIPVRPDTNGFTLTREDVEEAFIEDGDVHTTPTRLICLENTVRGLIHPLEDVRAIGDYAREKGVGFHLDGARLWETAAATGDSLHDLCAPFDTVSLCLSKGIAAPIGSILVGPKDVIRRARHLRKMFGGGWRQAGGLAAAAQHCIEQNLPRLKETHDRARALAHALHEAGATITVPVETNTIWFNGDTAGVQSLDLARHAWEKHRIRIAPPRIIIHVQTNDDTVTRIVDSFRDLAKTDSRTDEQRKLSATFAAGRRS